MAAATTKSITMPGTPRPWMNAIVRWMLRTRRVRRMLGRTVATITVTGAETGTRYTTPVQVFDHDGRRVMFSQRKRIWWRNIRTEPEVELLVQGERVDGRAEILDRDAGRIVLAAVLEENPRVAKFYGVEIDIAGRADPGGLDALVDAVVVIAIDEDV